MNIAKRAARAKAKSLDTNGVSGNPNRKGGKHQQQRAIEQAKRELNRLAARELAHGQHP